MARAGYQVAWAQGYAVHQPPLTDDRIANRYISEEMTMMYRLAVTVLLLFAINGEASAQTWHEIVPLRSSCEDVKRIRLNNFAAELLASSNYAAYVIAHGRSSKPREAHEHAARVKNYLVSRGVGRDRISIVDGAPRANWMIELFLVFRD